jgi:hypothetical protein
LCERGDTGVCDHLVMFRNIGRHPDRADDLAAHRDRYTAPHHDEASRGRGGGTLSIDGVLKRPARPTEESRRSGFAWREYNAARNGRVVHALQDDRQAVAVDDGNDAWPASFAPISKNRRLRNGYSNLFSLGASLDARV